ncbi:MAG: hypothetical protein MJA30_15940 [Cytophagales bacterium]|nr:hypothetical protein [Cytophagales bacterium]
MTNSGWRRFKNPSTGAIANVHTLFSEEDNFPVFHSSAHIKECAEVADKLATAYELPAEEIGFLFLAN